MVYDWDGREELCYRLYVEERRSLDEVMQIMRDEAGFAPSKRAFQTQFKRWDFPSKQNPAHKNHALVQRTKELWEKNTSQKEMLRILNDEGFDIKERELMRVRAKNRWLLRVPNGTKAFGQRPAAPPASMTTIEADPSLQTLERVIMEENNRELAEQQGLSQAGMSPSQEASYRELSPEVQKKRQARLEKLQAESAERWATKKRRRRTRGYSGLPADPPGPPRFPSETTIDESKAYLKMDNALYRQIRDQFTTICEEAGFVKKTVAGPEKWTAAKNRLIAENAHLQAQFYQDSSNLENKQLSLDVVCTDVTKRMRTLEQRMTIAEAKNILGVNPEESRIIRNAFYETLKADHFTSKLEAGEEHWKELKQQWVAQSDILQRIIAPGTSDPEHEKKLKAMEVMCRDVMKRLRDDQTKRDPFRKKQINSGPGPGPAPPRITTKPPEVNYPEPSATPEGIPRPVRNTTTKKVTGRAKGTRNANDAASSNEAQIDPSLLAAASDPAMALEQLQHYASAGSNLPLNPYTSPTMSRSQPDSPSRGGQPTGPIPIFFRLSPHSAYQTGPAVWLGSLASANPSIMDLRNMAARDHPWGAEGVVRIDGIVGNSNDTVGANGDADGGGEMAYLLEHDVELAGYLDFVLAGSGKATFSVQLAAVPG